MVKEEADLTLFLNLTAITELFRVKVRRIYESSALKKRDKTPPGRFHFSQVTEKFTGKAEAWSSYRAVAPQGNPLMN